MKMLMTNFLQKMVFVILYVYGRGEWGGILEKVIIKKISVHHFVL